MIVSEWLEKESRGSRTARAALNKGRTLQPAAGDSVIFDPICKVGRKVKGYAGDRCVVVGTRYDPPEGYPGAPPLVYVEFADGLRYWLNPWHLIEA